MYYSYCSFTTLKLCFTIVTLKKKTYKTSSTPSYKNNDHKDYDNTRKCDSTDYNTSYSTTSNFTVRMVTAWIITVTGKAIVNASTVGAGIFIRVAESWQNSETHKYVTGLSFIEKHLSEEWNATLLCISRRVISDF